MKFIHTDCDDDTWDAQHSASGRYIAPIRSPKDIDMVGYRRLRREHERDWNIRGQVSEQKFLAIVRRFVEYHDIDHVTGVRRATRNQDEKHKVDFWIRADLPSWPGHDIAIQIKSSWRGADEFILEHGDTLTHIYIVVMNEKMSKRKLLDRIRSIVRFEKKRLLIVQPAPP